MSPTFLFVVLRYDLSRKFKESIRVVFSAGLPREFAPFCFDRFVGSHGVRSFPSEDARTVTEGAAEMCGGRQFKVMPAQEPCQYTITARALKEIIAFEAITVCSSRGVPVNMFFRGSSMPQRRLTDRIQLLVDRA